MVLPSMERRELIPIGELENMSWWELSSLSGETARSAGGAIWFYRV